MPSLFLYAGLPGEPAFGPPAFMHRMSIMDSPEAPISHHWLDSTHITFGVVTAGLVARRRQARGVALQRPRARPAALRTSRPGRSIRPRCACPGTRPRNLSLQASWAHLISPEQLEPRRERPAGRRARSTRGRSATNGWWSTTLAWGRRSARRRARRLRARKRGRAWRGWTLFGRAERTENNELTFVGGHHGPAFDVGKVSLGAIRDFRVADERPSASARSMR